MNATPTRRTEGTVQNQSRLVESRHRHIAAVSVRFVLRVLERGRTEHMYVSARGDHDVLAALVAAVVVESH